MAILRYGGLDASLERAKRKAPAPYAAAYDWFVAHRNEVGPRPYGAHAPKDVELRLAAQRGIHKPGSYKYAISVTATGYETYQQDAIHYLDDDTWVLLYSEHRHSTGAKAGSPVYNKSLCLCLQAGLPVGVFIKEKTGYRCMGLAHVERYDEGAGTFLLHGPVLPCKDNDAPEAPLATRDQVQDLLSQAGRSIETELDAEHIDQLFDEHHDPDERERVLAPMVRRVRQQLFRKELITAYDGACAMTDCAVEPTLEAAHIMAYSGARSQLVTNGLLLRADLHTLYDRYLISVDPERFRIHVAPSLMASEYAVLDNRPLRLPRSRQARPEERRVAAHYADFLHENMRPA